MPDKGCPAGMARPRPAPPPLRPDAASGPTRRHGWWGIAAALVLGATGLRFLHVGAFVGGDHVRLLSGDSWYHLRRMALVADGAGLPDHDAWTHHPKGMVPHWPPLFDTAGGWLAHLLGGGSARLDRVAVAGIALVGAATAATFALAWWMSASRAGPVAGMLAVIALALSPAHHNYTRAGKLDHHAVEPLLVFLALDALLRAAAATGRAAWRWAAVAAIAMLALVATLPSSSIGILLLAGAAGLRALLANDRRRTGLVLAAAFGIAGLAAFPVAWASPMTRAGLVVSFNLSLLQPVLLLACAVGLAACAVIPGGRLLVAAGDAAAGAAIMLLWPAGRAAMLEGSGFVASGGFVALIDESQGLSVLGARFVLPFLSFAALLVPALLWWGIRRGDADVRVLSAVLATTTVLALQQVRFGVLFALPLAVLGGIAGARSIAWGRRRGRGALVTAGVVATAAALLLPSVPFVTGPPAGLAARAPVWEALAWLRDHSDSPGDAWRADARPAWSVMAPWGFGHEVLVLGRRANVASPFIAPGETEGLTDVLRFFLATSPAEGEALLEAHEARWVLTVPMPPATLAKYARVLGLDPASVPLGSTAAVALHERNGSAVAEAPQAWDGLRLVFVADGGEAKLFERVPGARLEGVATPGSEVLLRVDLDVAGSGWRWFALARADGAGRFAIRVPYATDAVTPGNVRVLGAAVRVNGRVLPVTVSEQAVQAGIAIPLS
jgi:asparagine N-glycosylation enzyme membrane subunit Stt3